ncbi:hypothetical protein GCM10011387_19810 [Pedobacter quisquiliarum]|uniref:Uncharacterized protein n=1 Tax=Pedobacter quisquiliarum TaxID=1834438 RepID=A0A916UBK2_9SPHI|nr:hypothetical protein GCM10011387_19810 [Pedobacter quisquiliarum]
MFEFSLSWLGLCGQNYTLFFVISTGHELVMAQEIAVAQQATYISQVHRFSLFSYRY